jgi:hypothetical protein
MPVAYLRTKATCPYKKTRPREVLQHECVCYDCCEYEPGCTIRPFIVSTLNGIPMRDILREREERPKASLDSPTRHQFFVDDVKERKPSWQKRFHDGHAILNGTYR